VNTHTRARLEQRWKRPTRRGDARIWESEQASQVTSGRLGPRSPAVRTASLRGGKLQPMEHLRVDRRPDLHDPIAIVAFSGWNDAASAATNAARFVVRRLGARRFAAVDPEDFFDFRETRPTVRIDSKGERQLHWPLNEFFYARNPTGPHDVVVAIGTEPALRWQTFARSFRGLFKDIGVNMTVSLGALMADVPHTREVRVTGTALDATLAGKLDLTTSRYEGPTGIVGVLHNILREDEIPAASLWANVPHYITTVQNPLATTALLRRLQPIIGLEFDFTELVAAGERFVAEVNTAISGNPEIVDYVHRLEAAADGGGEPTSQQPGPLPAGKDLVLDVEEFLRSQRDDA
jgi:proteasome assembly chaperone (PAC2) family protein